MSSSSEIARLKALISSPGGSADCAMPLSDEALGAMLAQYPCFELAAYHVCLRLAQDDSIRLPDGTQMASQSDYWLRMAKSFRPSAGGCLRRADE